MDAMKDTPAWAWSVGTVVAYLGLYTAFDKQTKTLKLSALTDVLLVRKGADATLVQWNKVISLAGLTTLGVALTPGSDCVVDSPTALIKGSAIMLMVHSLYSTFKYYGSGNIPVISSFPTIVSDARSDSSKDRLAARRKFSVLAGSAATALLNLCVLERLPLAPAAGLVVLELGWLHFYFMEIDFRGKLAVRPFGYLAFITPKIAISAGLAKLWW